MLVEVGVGHVEHVEAEDGHNPTECDAAGYITVETTAVLIA